MRNTPLIFTAALAVSTAAFVGCDSKEDKGTVTPSDATAQVHKDEAKDKMSNAGDAMKDAGSNLKDAAKQTGGAIEESAKAARDKMSSSTPSTAPSAHVDVTVTPPTTRP